MHILWNKKVEKNSCQLSILNRKPHKTEFQKCHWMNTTSSLKICWKPASSVALSWETLTFFALSGPRIAIETLATGRNTNLILQKRGAVTEVAQAVAVTLQASRGTSWIGWKAQPHWDTAKTMQPLVHRAVPQGRNRNTAAICVLPTWQK